MVILSLDMDGKIYLRSGFRPILPVNHRSVICYEHTMDIFLRVVWDDVLHLEQELDVLFMIINVQ